MTQPLTIGTESLMQMDQRLNIVEMGRAVSMNISNIISYPQKIQ